MTTFSKDFLVSTGDFILEKEGLFICSGIANTNASIEVTTQENVIKAGKMNKTQYILKYGRELKVSIEAQDWNLAFIAANTNSTIAQQLTDVYRINKTLTVTAGSVTLPDVPVSNYIHVETPDRTVFEIAKPASGSVIDLTAQGITDGSVKVTYKYNKTAKVITIDADSAPIIGTMTIDIDKHNSLKGKVGSVQLIIPALQLDGNFTLNLTPDGVTTTGLNGQALVSEDESGKECYGYLKEFETIDVAATVTGIVAIPAKISTTVGGTANIGVIGTRTGLYGNVMLDNGDCTFTSGTPAVATVVADTGVVTGVSAGTSIITVTYGAFVSIVEVTVA